MNMVHVAAALLALTLPVQAQQPAAKPVKLITVEQSDGGLVRQFFGQVVARQTVDLAFQVSGQIVEFPALEGATIPKGGLIARLDLETFGRALEQARLQKEQADRTVERLEKLSGNTVSQVSIDDAATQAGLAALAVQNAEYALEQATLPAPFDALVAARNVANFTTINAGTPVVRLHDMSELRIDIEVPEILFQRAGEDPDAELTATFPTSGQSYPLEVREFNAETSSVGQTFTITFALPAQEGLNVLPGSSVTVTARLRSGAPVIALPASALLSGGTDGAGATAVMVFRDRGDGEGTVERRPVGVSVSDSGGFHVTSGLEAGEEVVTAGVAALQDGQTVRRFTGFPE